MNPNFSNHNTFIKQTLTFNRLILINQTPTLIAYTFFFLFFLLFQSIINKIIRNNFYSPQILYIIFFQYYMIILICYKNVYETQKNRMHYLLIFQSVQGFILFNFVQPYNSCMDRIQHFIQMLDDIKSAKEIPYVLLIDQNKLCRFLISRLQ